ncbi:hypothetical protein HMPREF1069_00757 [Bacteroides ovatus CL02T12C04]|jgi:hypothetical protein|nr:hypothetical protein HMPREF1069_00757 [Bacteroides ovatus CL02T12C04]
MDYEKLTEKEKAELRAKLEAEDKAKKQKQQEDRETYKTLTDKFVTTNIKKLQNLSSQMMLVKQEVFRDADLLINMKDELFKTKVDRRSNTFTTQDGLMSITLGNRVNEGWDDTVNAGIAKVKDYLASLAKDDDTAALVETVMGLLAKDRKGNLKASKVLELEKLAQKKQDEMFLDGIAIIRAAYRPEPSCQFIEVTLKDENGNEIKLPLSLAAMK